MALAHRGFLKVADGIEDLRWARLGGVLGIALVAWIVFRTLVRAGWNRFQSFCVGVIVCSISGCLPAVSCRKGTWFLPGDSPIES